MTYDPTTWVLDTIPCIHAVNLNNIEHGTDIAQGDVMKLWGLTADIPATDPELIGRLYIESDGQYRVQRDNGAGWDVIYTI